MYQLSKKGTPNSWLKRLWDLLAGKDYSKTEPLQGLTTKTASKIKTSKDYSLYIPETVIRGGQEARELVEMKYHCYEVRHVLSYAARDCFASSDGDDIGWSVADTLDDNETPINPEVKAILDQLITRRNQGRFVIGGGFLKQAVRETLAYGDCFLEIAIEREGIGRKDYGISKTNYLPTWEMFRVTDDRGNLSHYEQRARINDSDPILFLPINIVQFSYERQNNYGQSLFLQSRQYWHQYKDAMLNLMLAARDTVASPYVHSFPEYYDSEAKSSYIEDYLAQSEDGIVTNFFLDSGIAVQKLSGNPNFSSLIDYLNEAKYRIIPPGFPVWMFPGMDTSGAKDIAGQPALTYSRMRNDWCAMISEGIRWMCDVELCLKLGFDRFLEIGQYRIVFPKFVVNPANNQGQMGEDGEDDESDSKGIEDLDD